MLSAAFSASETAFTSLSLVQKRHLKQDRSRAGRMAYKLCCRADSLITTVLVGNNIVNIAESALVTSLVIQRFGNVYVALATGILTVAILVFGEITPKQFALVHNTGVAKAMAYPLRWAEILLFPLVRLFVLVSRLLTALFTRKKEGGDLSVDALFDVIDVAKDEGVVDPYEQDLVQRVLHFSQTSVKSIMTHRTRVYSVEERATVGECFASVVGSGFSRIPVYRDNPENIVGVVLTRDLEKKVVARETAVPVSDLMIKPIFIPESMKADELFRHFKRHKLQMAVVLDEYGGLSGVVSMEDVSEQLLGEIYDEHESGLPERIEPAPGGGGAFTVMCDVSFREFIDEFGFKVDNASSYSTLASYILERAGVIPQAGDRIDTPLGRFTVTQIKGRRLETADFVPASID